MVRFYCNPEDLLILSYDNEGEFFKHVKIECPCNECRLPGEETPQTRVLAEILDEFGNSCDEIVEDDIVIIKMVTDEVSEGQYIVAVFRDCICAELFENEACIDLDGSDLENAVNQEFPLAFYDFCECGCL